MSGVDPPLPPAEQPGRMGPYFNSTQIVADIDAARSFYTDVLGFESVIDVDRIERLSAARNYVSVHAGGREYVVRETLANICERLPTQRFVRTHRSHVVNVGCVTELRASRSGGREAVLGSGAVVPVSRSYRNAVEERFGAGAV